MFGMRGRQAMIWRGISAGVIADPSGDPIELFEPLAAYHERGPDTQAAPPGLVALRSRGPASDGVQHLPAVHQRVLRL